MLMKTAAQTLAEQLCAVFAQRIRDRLLAPGARLPSVRLCAQQQKVSPSTVVTAYDQLLAQGLIQGRQLVIAEHTMGFAAHLGIEQDHLHPFPRGTDDPRGINAGLRSERRIGRGLEKIMEQLRTHLLVLPLDPRVVVPVIMIVPHCIMRS